MNVEIQDCAKDIIDIAIEGRSVAEEDIADSHEALRELHYDLHNYINRIKDK
jgi:hypothetical protein